MLDQAELYRIIDAQQQLMAIDDVDRALAWATRAAMMMTGASGAVVELVDESELVYQAGCGVLAASDGVRLRRNRSLSGLCVELGHPLRADDTAQDPRVDKAACARLGVLSMVCAPLGGVAPGVLKVVSGSAHAFDERHEEIIEMFARGVAGRLDLARRSAPSSIGRRSVMSFAISEAPERTMLEAVVDSMQESVVIIDRDGEIVLMNEAAHRLVPDQTIAGSRAFSAQTGDPLDMSRRPIMRALRGETIRQLEVAVQTAERGMRWVSVNASPMRDEHGRVTGAVSIARDVTELRHARDTLEASALHDELTGLLNRRGFLERAGAALRLADRTKRPAALVYMDLNGMKAINDKLGHAAGDRALVEFADVLRKTLRDTDLVARLGGDEFAVLAIDCDTEDDAIGVRQRIEDAARARTTGDGAFQLSVSAGALRYVPSAMRCGIEQLLADADSRMYEAKRLRKRYGTQRTQAIAAS